MSVKKIIDKHFRGGLYYLNTVPVKVTTNFDDDWLRVYYLECDYQGIHRKITLYFDMMYFEFSGNIEEGADWRQLNWIEVEQARKFLITHGYLGKDRL